MFSIPVWGTKISQAAECKQCAPPKLHIYIYIANPLPPLNCACFPRAFINIIHTVFIYFLNVNIMGFFFFLVPVMWYPQDLVTVPGMF